MVSRSASGGGWGAEERRYSEAEFRRILDEASRAGEVQVPSPEIMALSGPHDGLTLHDIQEIAREVLVDPAAVERAARNLPDPRLIRVPTEPGGPFARVMRGELIIGRALDDREMRMLVLEAERALARRGHIQRSADGVEWRDDRNRVTVHVVRGETATRVSVTFDQFPELAGGSGLLAGGGLIGTGVVAVSLSGPLLLAAVPLAIGGTAGLIVLNAVGRRAITRERLRQFLEQLDEGARSAS
jgi:hypothetical protein